MIMAGVRHAITLGVLAGVLATGPSLRAEPLPSGSAVEAEAVREVDRLSAWVRKNGGTSSAIVLEIETGRVLAQADALLELNPASNAKVLTAATALARLGVDHRFTSGIYGAMVDGQADRLVLRSDGDPTLSSRDLERMASSLVSAGLTRVSGDILVDQSRFDGKFVPPAFEQQPDEWASFRAPVSAVSVDENAFVIAVRPEVAKKRAKVSVQPAGFVDIVNEIDTVARSDKKKITVTMEPRPDRLRVKLTGVIPEGHKGVSFVRRVDDPRLFAGYVLAATLTRLGVKLDGGVKLGGKDEKRALVEQSSKPLGTLVAQLGKNSDNFYAEMLLKAVGAERTKTAGSSADGANAVLDWMKQASAQTPGMRIQNGSGLFDANRVSAASLAQALTVAYRDPSIGTAFLAQLAVGGVDGTLKSRFSNQRKRRAIRAKTGTLAKAHSLSGYVLGPKDKSPLAFAIVVNGIAGKPDEQRKRIDRVVEQVARELWE
jgi:D-alanyl-D-alanine carboxypeptidase/D-alanyl-D-alanine-endopeptidase (penicillin-binding protein 4)